MKAEVTIKTSVLVDLGDFATCDLIQELEGRGHAVDSDCAAELNTADLIHELAQRRYEEIIQCPTDRLIVALEHLGCPQTIISQLKDWDKEPIVTESKLKQWLLMCGVAP